MMDELEFAELAAGYVLDSLSPADRHAFEAARAAHPEWEQWVRADAATAAALADGVADALPPLTLRSTLLSRVAAMPQLPGIDAAAAAAAAPAASPEGEASAPFSVRADVEAVPDTSMIQAVSRANWTRGLLALAASFVLLVVLGFGAASINESVNRPPAVAALDEIEAAPDAQSATAELSEGGTATAHWSESIGKAVLVSDGLPEIDADETFELWFVRDGGPVSAGTFEPAKEGASTIVLDGAMQPGDVIAVTVEAQGGSTTGAPTTDPIVEIPTEGI